MEEQKKTFTEKEVMDIVSKMQNDCNTRLQDFQNKANAAIEQLNGTISRLNFLLQIVNIKGVFSPEFIIKCAEEIEEIMTIKEEEPEDKE